jgi:hypothetical protein
MPSVLETQLRNALEHVAAEAYPGRRIYHFYLRLEDEAPKTKYGHYHLQKREIVVFHLSRDLKCVTVTSLHELSHHLDFTFTGRTCHNAQFYRCYRPLVEAAIRLRYLDPDGLRLIESDIRKIERVAGRINMWIDQAVVRPDDHNAYIKVRNASQHRGRLRDLGFRFDELQRCYFLKVTPETVVGIKRELLNFLPKESLSIQDARHMTLEKLRYVKVYRSYDVRTQLRGLGFTFRPGPPPHWMKEVSEDDAARLIEVVQGLSKEVSVHIDRAP